VLYVVAFRRNAELDSANRHRTDQLFRADPEFIGRRIGPWFLHQAIELCWDEPIKRLL